MLFLPQLAEPELTRGTWQLWNEIKAAQRDWYSPQVVRQISEETAEAQERGLQDMSNKCNKVEYCNIVVNKKSLKCIQFRLFCCFRCSSKNRIGLFLFFSHNCIEHWEFRLFISTILLLGAVGWAVIMYIHFPVELCGSPVPCQGPFCSAQEASVHLLTC